jgi:hypothetical protein
MIPSFRRVFTQSKEPWSNKTPGAPAFPSQVWRPSWSGGVMEKNERTRGSFCNQYSSTPILQYFFFLIYPLAL